MNSKCKREMKEMNMLDLNEEVDVICRKETFKIMHVAEITLATRETRFSCCKMDVHHSYTFVVALESANDGQNFVHPR